MPPSKADIKISVLTPSAGIMLPANRMDLVKRRIKGALNINKDTATKIQPKKLSQPSVSKRAKESPKVRTPTENAEPIIMRQRRSSLESLRMTVGIK